MHEKVRQLYSLVAHDAVTGGHKEIADREFRAAKNWRRATVATIGVTMAWLLYSMFCVEPITEPEREFWLHLGKSVSLTALMLSFGVYASKQSALHRVSERRARAFFLQVQAFDPFIASLEPADRQELKKALSTRIFGPDDPQHDKAILDNGDFKSLDKLLSVMESFKKLFGKA
jgi:hypothetical protein